jgi:hypothetical protein
MRAKGRVTPGNSITSSRLPRNQNQELDMARCSQCGKNVSLLDRDIFTGACRECRGVGARPATLGCGTLVLIGIVVAMVTTSGFNNIEQRLTRLQHAVDSLQKEIAHQTADIRALRTQLSPAAKPPGAKAR